MLCRLCPQAVRCFYCPCGPHLRSVSHISMCADDAEQPVFGSFSEHGTPIDGPAGQAARPAGQAAKPAAASQSEFVNTKSMYAVFASPVKVF